ncbi:hypothetical protein WJ96_04355 [Burkholderia ubonensis]|uniref:Uncharacterized protein n=2 Tax=Burkholderia ubonensis TaxID=101571 RepID=A0AAW3MT89_9BURK|nr:hypothetical protein WJ96_04355 [Burkholderia ubonensis]KVZ92504.1 hypothetical protein WL25_16010 [Burkholderia ubonensis]
MLFDEETSMTMKQKTISEDSFFDTYKPVKNHFSANAPWNGCMFETYGRELEHVQAVLKTDSNKVWTVLSCDGALTVSSGYHHVNRMGYIITEVPVADDEMVETEDEDAIDDEEDDDEDANG